MYKNGVTLIGEERNRQIIDENWSSAHDDEHDESELPEAALCYLSMALRNANVYNSKPDHILHENIKTFWPWPDFPIKEADTERNLVKAGALIAAEIDRRNRLYGKVEMVEESRRKVPHKCPICEGHGNVSGGFFNAVAGANGWSSAVAAEKCIPCNGTGIIYS